MFSASWYLRSARPWEEKKIMPPARHREGREEFVSEPAQAAASLKLQSPKGQAINRKLKPVNRKLKPVNRKLKPVNRKLKPVNRKLK